MHTVRNLMPFAPDALLQAVDAFLNWDTRRSLDDMELSGLMPAERAIIYSLAQDYGVYVDDLTEAITFTIHMECQS